MALPASPAELFALDLNIYQVYGLFFLLGTFVVASISDIKHLAAQREFMDVWLAFVAVMAVLDAWRVGFAPDPGFLLKWALIILLSVLSWHRVGFLFWLLMKALSIPMGRALRKGDYYPFLPVVTLATVALLALAWWLAGAVLPSPATAATGGA